MTRVASSPCQYCRRSLPEMSALFPTLMKVEIPTWRCRARASKARPKAPLWDDIATLPRGGSPGEPDVGIGIDEPHRVRPDDAHSEAPRLLDEILLKSAPHGVGLRETGCDDDDRSDADNRAVVHGREHPVARDGHDGEISSLRELSGRGIDRDRVDARDRK